MFVEVMSCPEEGVRTRARAFNVSRTAVVDQMFSTCSNRFILLPSCSPSGPPRRYPPPPSPPVSSSVYSCVTRPVPSLACRSPPWPTNQIMKPSPPTPEWLSVTPVLGLFFFFFRLLTSSHAAGQHARWRPRESSRFPRLWDSLPTSLQAGISEHAVMFPIDSIKVRRIGSLLVKLLSYALPDTYAGVHDFTRGGLQRRG
jgi:hypothetical protein